MFLCLLPCRCLLGAIVLSAAPAWAGLSLEAMEARHRRLQALAGGEPVPVPLAPAGAFAAQAGEPPAAVPALIASPLAGGAGLSIAHTLIERDANPLGAELRLGVMLDQRDDQLRLTGSEISVPAGPGLAYLSSQTRHWGPSWFGSLILDGAAQPLTAAGWRVGDGATSRWSADLFAGTLRGHSDPDRPWLIGMHLEWRPTPAWTIGLARTLQWGGAGRDESLSSLWRGLIGSDTVGRSGVDASNQPGNQLAGFDLRFDAGAAGIPAGAYVQLVAEDKGYIVPTRRLRLAGADASTTIGGVSLRGIVEWTRTTAGKAPGLAYVHPLYPAGYTHRGQPLGHPIGGDARLTSAGLLLDGGPVFALLALHHGRALTAAQRFPPGDRLEGVDLALRMQAQPHLTLGASMHGWRSGPALQRWAQAWIEYRWR